MHNLIGQNETASGNLLLHSSLERSNRSYACPGESVSYSCAVVGGQGLSWEVNGSDVAHSLNNGVFACYGSGTCDFKSTCYTLSGVILNVTRNVSNQSKYHSTMTVTPEILHNETLELIDMRACSHDEPLNITCHCLGPGGKKQSLLYQVAGIIIIYAEL